MQNVEFKAELKDLALARSICLALGAQLAGILDQTDTYYLAKQGRLKKRETVGEPTEWILYERPDTAGNRVSTFKIYTENEAEQRFRAVGLTQRVVVKKLRELYVLGNVRIHLDQVEGLGPFLEFEAMVSPRQGEPECQREVTRLRRELSPALGEAIAVGYAEMIEQGLGEAP